MESMTLSLASLRVYTKNIRACGNFFGGVLLTSLLASAGSPIHCATATDADLGSLD